MGLPRRVGARVRPCFESKRRAHQKSGLRGEARPDVADELQGRGCVRVRGPVDTILQDQVLLGERLGPLLLELLTQRDEGGAGVAPAGAETYDEDEESDAPCEWKKSRVGAAPSTPSSPGGSALPSHRGCVSFGTKWWKVSGR